MSKEIDHGGPAFPDPMFTRQADGQPMAVAEYGLGGMSRRQWLAGMAMQGMIAKMAFDQPVEDMLLKTGLKPEQFESFVADLSYSMADAMIAAEKGVAK